MRAGACSGALALTVPRTGLRTALLAGALAGLGLLAACGGAGRGGGVETGEASAPPAPNLMGARVMLVPAQAGEPEMLDAELAFWLTDRGTATDWVLPQALEAAVRRAPGSGLNLDAPRQVVDVGGRDRRIADPLYGDLRRLGAITDATLALVPLASRETTDSAGVSVELVAALVMVRAGRVIWMHTVAGEPAASLPEAVASAAAELARTLIPSEG